jgi:hypothetical protein
MGQIPTVRENRERTFPNETYVKNVKNRKGEIHTHMARWKRTQGEYPASVNTHPPRKLYYDGVPPNSFSVCLRRTGNQNFLCTCDDSTETLTHLRCSLWVFLHWISRHALEAQFLFTLENASEKLLILPNFSESLRITGIKENLRIKTDQHFFIPI